MKHIISLLLFLPLITFGQKIKNLPEPFYAPISFENQKDRDAFAIKASKEKKGELWLIAGDRENVTLLDKRNGKPSGQFLKFKETAFVIDEDKEWVKIGVGSKEDNKFRYLTKSGWVKKKEVLLWPQSLKDQETRVRKLALVGYTSLSGLCDLAVDFDKIKIYDGPTSSNIINKVNAFGLFYIFKEEQHRILIGTADFFTRNNANENILGWVNESHVIKWNGRLALECNWEEPSYSQRQNDSLKRVYGFTSQLSADLYGKTGSLNSAHIIWDNDPAKSDYSQKLRSDENNRRKVGEVFRFPVWNITSGYYSSMALLKLDLDLDAEKKQFDQVKNFIKKLSDEAQSTIREEKPTVMIDLYLPLSLPGVEHPYKYVIFMPEIEIEEYVAQLRNLQRSLNGPSDVIRDQLYNTVISLILKMSGDKMTRKQIDIMDISEFMGWIIGLRGESLEIDLKGISIKDILDKKMLSDKELTNWASNLSSKEKKLASIMRNRGSYPYSFTVGDAVYFWLDIDDLDWMDMNW